MHTLLPAFLLCALLHGSSAVAASSQKCDPIDTVVSLLRGPLKTSASSFCSSYLRLPIVATTTTTTTKTATNTQTSTSNPTSTGTTTITVTSAVTNTLTTYSPNPTTTETAFVTYYQTRTLYQRRRGKRGLPQLATFAASRLSSACSCVVTPTTSTTTKTATVTATARTDIIVPGTRIVYVTQTEIVQTTSLVDITTTLAPTSTITLIVTSTIYPTVVKPKICNAKGVPGANAFNYKAIFDTNQADCLQQCKTDNMCLATSFYILTDPATGSQTATCRSYDKPVADSADLGVGYFTFSDRNC